MVALANCRRCGKLFSKMYHDLCPACVEQEEQDFEKVYQFLRENGPSHIDIIHEGTGVDKKLIMKFLSEGRFEGASISYRCESCGAAITGGKLCDKCAKDLNSQITKMHDAAAPQKKIDNQSYLRQTSLDRYGRRK